MSEPSWLSPRALARLAEAEEIHLSPDGRGVATVMRTAGGAAYRRDVWLADVDGDARPRRLTPGRGSATGARWSSTGERLAWIRDVAGGVRIEVHDIWDTRTTAVTDTLDDVDEIAWSPDGRRLAFTGRLAEPSAPTRMVDAVSTLTGDRGPRTVRPAALYILELATHTVRAIHEGEGDLEAPRWSPDGQRLSVRARVPGGYRSTITVVETGATGPGRPLAVAGTLRSRFRQAAWSPDSTSLLLVGGLELSFHPGLWTFDVATSALEELVPDPRCEVVDDPIWYEADRAILHGRERARSGIYEIDLRTADLRMVANVDGRLWALSADRAVTRIAQIRESVAQPPAPVVFDRSTLRWRDVGLRRTARHPMPEAERRAIRCDGADIDYWLLRPSGVARLGKAPAVFLVHGGPHLDVGDEWEGGLRQLLASAGFAVAWANPRGSTSYGRRFADAVIGDFGGGEFRDLLAVVDAVAMDDEVDGARLGICGHSHGGYMTAWAIARSDRFRAAVAMSPVFDLLSEWGMSDEGVAWGEVLHGGSPGERPELYRDRSPSTHAWQARTPTLIVHGARDERCPIGQSELMFATLRAAGCSAELVRYPDAGHDLWTSPAVVEDLDGRIVDWFGRWLEAPRRDG